MAFGLSRLRRRARGAAAQDSRRRHFSGREGRRLGRQAVLGFAVLEDRRLLSGVSALGLEEQGPLVGDAIADPALALVDSGPWLATSEGPVFPTNYEQYLVELINRARADPEGEAARYGIDLNEGLAAGTISSSPKQPLAINPYLVNAARGHSQWMIDTDVFSHTGTAGSSPGDRMSAAGYAFIAPWSWGENIAWTGTTGSSLPPISTTDSLHRALFVDSNVAGRGHRLNLMNSSFREGGAGIVFGNFTGYNAEMVTEDFAYSGSSRFLTGVAYDDRLVSRDNFYTPGEGLGSVTITARRSSDGATFTTTTWSSGGYSLALSAGTYTVTATGGGLGGTVTFQSVVIGSVNVKVDFTTDLVNGNHPPTADAGGPYYVTEGGTVTLSGARSSDPEQSAATLTYEWDLDGDGVFGEQGAGALRGNETGMSPVFSAVGLDGPSTRTVSLRVYDAAGAASNIVTAQITIANVSPVITQLALTPQLGRANQPVQLTITFTDPGTPDRHTAQIDWGQGTPQTVSVTAGARSVTVSHVYTADGFYSATVTVTDDDGGSSGPMPLDVIIKSGDVAGPHAYVLGNGVSIATGDATPSSADFTDFGWAHEATSGPTRTFIVANDGTQTLNLGVVSIPAGYTLVQGLPSSLAPRTWASFTVRLDTTVRGVVSGNITFSTNRGDQNPFTFAITGTVGPVAAPYNLSAAATSATSVQLAWQNPNSAVDRFTIDWKTDGFRDPWSTPEELPGGTTAWQATGLVPFVAYRYRLIGYSATGNPGTDEIQVMFDGGGNCWTLGKDHRLLRNGVLVRGDTEDFLVTSDGYLYWLGTGGVFERRPIGGGAWERLDDDAVRFQVVDGVAYSVGADKWLNRNGVPMWTNTLDYYIMPEDTPSSPLGTVYWHGFYGAVTGILQRLKPGATTWQDLDQDAIRYEIDSNGVCYSIGRDGWLNREGDRQWQNTKDYVIEAHTNPALNNTIYWLGTSGVFQRQRPGTTVWQDLDQDAVSFTIDDGGIAYSVGRDYWLNREGVPMWHKTRAFRILADRSIYWFGWDNTYAGIVERLPYQASGWQRLDVDATKVAIRDAWVAYSLGKDKRVNYEGTPTWDNVDDMFIDGDGCLVMKRLAGDVLLSGSYFEML